MMHSSVAIRVLWENLRPSRNAVAKLALLMMATINREAKEV